MAYGGVYRRRPSLAGRRRSVIFTVSGAVAVSDGDTATGTDAHVVVAPDTAPLTTRVPGHTLRGTHTLRQSVGTVAKADGDTATGTSAEVLSPPTFSDPDTGAGASAEISIALTNDDTGSGTSAEGALAPADTDTGSVESAEVTIALNDNDDGSGASAEQTLDTGGGIVNKSGDDTGAGTSEEVPSIALTDVATDPSAGTSAEGSIALTNDDNGAGGSGEGQNAPADSDTGSASSDHVASIGVTAATDTGTGASAETTLDTGAGISKNDSDTASGASAEVSIVVVPVTGEFLFTPGVVYDIPTTLMDAPRIYNRLMRFYDNRPRGVNIWKLIDDSYTTAQPWPLFDDSEATRVQMGDNNDIEPTFKIVYYGGHTYTVSAAEAAAIQAAINAGDIDGELVPA